MGKKKPDKEQRHKERWMKSIKIEYHEALREHGFGINGSRIEKLVNVNEDKNSIEYYRRVVNGYTDRQKLVEKFAWAVPTVEAISRIAEMSPIIEIGCGTGYWAYLLKKIGDADIIAFDKAPPGGEKENSYRHKRTWTEVFEGGPEMVEQYPNHTLFLCWPPYDDDMALQCVRRSKGDLVFIGEGEYGCTADNRFFNYVNAKKIFCDEEYIEIPQWDGIHDGVSIYKRKNKKG